jgi:hypothetical protein
MLETETKWIKRDMLLKRHYSEAKPTEIKVRNDAVTTANDIFTENSEQINI